MKIFQILHGMCHWETPFKSLDEIVNRFPTDCLFVEAPDYVTEQWGFDETEIGDDRFIAPSIPENLVMNDDTGTFVEETVLEQALAEAKDAKQEENNTKLAEFINSHPITWTDGKKYGITSDNQTEIRNAMEAYRAAVDCGIENPSLKWHAVNEPFTDWTYEELQKLYVAIYNEANKWVAVNSEYKTTIYACESTADLNAIIILYETDEEKAEREAREAEEANDLNGIPTEEEPATEEPTSTEA